MAHALRYYKEIQQDNGQIIRLEIHKKDSALPAVEIGRVLQALHLDIQGGADTIDAPIVKTSLTMTFVDAPDLEEGKKCGNWEEFYTPDSTMWKVVLKADGETIWGGYVTPDSYQEDLRYRGSVTIIARDNIGHMQDFPFDMEGNADGMVTLQELVDEAWAKIESPMILDWRHEEDDAMYLLCDGVEAPQTYMNVSAFEDMNYFDAVEKALYSYGLVMRYTGSNRVRIMSLRDVPYQGKSSAPRAVEPIFLAHAQRELAPAVRRIEESVKYEFTDGIQIPLAKNVSFSGVAYTVPFYSTNVFGETTTKSIPVHAIANTDGEGWSNVPSSTLFFNPKKYTIRQTALAEDAERMLFLACNTDGSHSAIYRKTVICADFRINMTFGRPVERDSYGGVGYCYGFSDSDDREQNGIGSLSARSVDCYISREQNGIQQFFDGHTWGADAVLLTIEVTDRQCGIDVPLGDSSGTAEVTLTIVDVRLNDKWDFSDGLGLYIPISSMYWGVAETASLCETNNVNTVYVHTNNVILEHSPELAPALDEVPFPSVIKNGIFVRSGSAYLPAKGWAWSGGTPQQMAVYNHLQLLCYHSKPNNIISGDIVNADFVDMEAIYEWGGVNHLLVSGSYNFLNGRIESAVLREFKFYTDMWSNVSGTSLPDTEQNNRTTAESGSGASKAATYSNETTVNIGGTGGGGTGGSSTLAGLLDVQVSSPSNGQALVYDSASGMWMNKTIEKGDKVTSSTIIAALGYTPLNADSFTKANIKSVLGISDWALGASMPLASSSVRGGVKVGFSAKYQNGSYYSIPVELDSENAFVKLTKTMVSTALGFTPVSSADIEVTKAKVISALGYTPMNQADFTGDNIVLKLGYTPFDSDAFTKSNIKNALGIADWALAASKPSYTWTDIGSRPTALSAFTNDLGLGSLAYKSSLVASDIPSLPWSKITSGKPTTLSGYGITDAYTKTNADAKFLQQAGGTITGDVIVNTKLTSTVIEALQFKADGKLIMHRNAGAGGTYINYGGRTEWLRIYGSEINYYIGDETILAMDKSKNVSMAYSLSVGRDLTIGGGMLGGVPSGATYPRFRVFSHPNGLFFQAATYDGTSTAGKIGFTGYAGETAEDIYFNANTIRLLGKTTVTGDASFAQTIYATGNITTAGELNAKNYMIGQYLPSAPLDSFATAIFGKSDSDVCKMRLQQCTVTIEGVGVQYSPVLAVKTFSTHGFISFGYNSANKDKCYIGAGNGDAVNWSGILFHNNMNLIPKTDNTYTLGDSSYRWKEVNAVSIKIGDATLTWDATAGMLKIDKGVYIDGAITAKKKA